MAITAFIPELWTKTIDTARKDYLVAKDICNTTYTGLVKEAGDTVHILGATRPTISTLASATTSLGNAESLTGSSIDLTINKIHYYNFLVNDIEAAQSSGDVMGTYTKDAAIGLASAQDAYILSTAANNGTYDSATYDSSTALQITESNVLAKLDAAAQKLYENNVPMGESIYAIVTPRFWTILKNKVTALDTANSEELRNGTVAKYAGITIKVSNNVLTASSGAEDKIVVCSGKALAFADPLSDAEAIRSDSYFSDIVRGYTVCGCAIARKTELAIINAKYTA